MDAKGVIITLISVIFGIAAVNGLWSAGEGYLEMIEGKQLENPQMASRGRKAMMFGLAVAGGMGGFLAALIAAINALNI